MPPVDLVRIGKIDFVGDGHHRVSVACALGLTDIDAYVTEVVTGVGAERRSRSPIFRTRATSECSSSAYCCAITPG